MKEVTKIFSKAKIKLAKHMKLSFASVVTDEGITLYYDAEEFRDGIEVFVIDEEGNYYYPENGNYVVDGRTAVIEDGIVTSYTENSAEDMQDVPNEEELPEPATGDSPTAEEFNELLDVVAEMIEAQHEQEAEIEALKVELSNAKKTSNAEPIIPTTKLSSKVDFSSTESKRDAFFNGWKNKK